MSKRIQDLFWTKEYAEDYSSKNRGFDDEPGKQ